MMAGFLCAGFCLLGKSHLLNCVWKARLLEDAISLVHLGGRSTGIEMYLGVKPLASQYAITSSRLFFSSTYSR